MINGNQNGNTNGNQAENKSKEVHPALYKTFLIMAMVSFTLGALVNYYTLKQLSKR